MAGNSAFEMVSQRGWRRGLDNLLDNELGRWWHTRLWWTQALIWSCVVGFMTGATIRQGDANREAAIMIYSIFAGIFPAVAVIILMQGALVGEKATGTAAWVLSKPISRPAFILAKGIASSLGVLVTMVVIPGLVAYPLLCIGSGSLVNPFLFLAGMGVTWLSLLFYLSLTLMLGAFFRSRGPVIGIALGLLFLQQYLIALVPLLKYALPWMLVAPLNNTNTALLPDLLQGKPVSSSLPILIVVCLEEVVFILLAIWRFKREEF